MTLAFAKAFADPRLPYALRDRRRHAYARLYRMLSGSYADSGQWAAATRTIAIALRHDPRIARELIRDVHRMPVRHLLVEPAIARTRNVFER